MKLAFLKNRLLIPAILSLSCFQAAGMDVARADAPGRSEPPLAIATFHCLGLYWSPDDGAADKEVGIRYRRQGVAEWSDGLPMRYNPIPNTPLGQGCLRLAANGRRPQRP